MTLCAVVGHEIAQFVRCFSPRCRHNRQIDAQKSSTTHSVYDSLSRWDCIDSLRSMTSPSRLEAEVITPLLFVVAVSSVGVWAPLTSLTLLATAVSLDTMLQRLQLT